MAKHFGSDADTTSISWQFRGIRAGAKIQKDAVAKGKDPKDFNVIVNHKGESRQGKCALKPRLSSRCSLSFRVFLFPTKFT